MKKIAFLAAGVAFAAAFAVPATAAELTVKPRVVAKPDGIHHTHLCPQGKRIFTDLPYSHIVEAVYAYHDEAVVAAEQSQFSRSMRYNWALETKAWCGSAIGFSKTRTLDEETVAKCACFHYTMIRQR